MHKLQFHASKWDHDPQKYTLEQRIKSQKHTQNIIHLYKVQIQQDQIIYCQIQQD